MGVIAGVIVVVAFISVFTAMNMVTSGLRRNRNFDQPLIDPRTGQPVQHRTTHHHGGSAGGHHGGHHGGFFGGGGHDGGGFSGGGHHG